MCPDIRSDPEFLETFRSLPDIPYNDVAKMVPETYDHIVAGPKGAEEFITSDQCMSCHSGATGAFGPNMFLQTGPIPPGGPPPGVNVSPYGEWRWSPMGLAGRDPVFYAQFESEIAYLNTIKDPKTREQDIRDLTNMCFRCHGAMGKHQLNIDQGPNANFKTDFLKITDQTNPNFKYGALARDGISCTVCHRIAPNENPSFQYFLDNTITGQFNLTKPEVLNGPFKDDTISPFPMKNSLGIDPKFNSYLSDSRMCGSCHTINLPILDKPPVSPIGPNTSYSLEQVTYLEWLNSEFQNEFQPWGSNPKSCADCHMPGGYEVGKLNVPQIQAKIANIEDQSFPAADNRAPTKEIDVLFRETGFKRHQLQGLNIPLLEMFSQFNDILGVRLNDYMSGATNDLPNAIENFTQQARKDTATVDVAANVAGDLLTATVTVKNKTGHRMPSGVGFRRAFIEFLVVNNEDGREQVIWASGRTNELGVIVDGQGKVLPSEFFTEYRDKQGKLQQHFQPHHEKITEQNQVQIYEELVKDAAGKFTTSFIRRDEEVKDNRLLPKGWTKQGPAPSQLKGVYLESTHPRGNAEHDPQYEDGSGSDIVTYEIRLPKGVNPANVTVKATLYYQSIPPYFLNDRFRGAPNGEATRRLYYLTSNLKVEGTPIEDWKLKLVSAAAQVGATQSLAPYRRNTAQGVAVR